MLAVISPAKTQDFSPVKAPFTQARQLEDSQILVDLLKNKSADEISNLMNISEKLAKLNFQRFQDFSKPLKPNPAKQALLAFQGGVYQGLNASTLSTPDLTFAQDNVRMLSGLYGVLRPLDLICPYRLEMGAKLKNPRGDNLYQFWGEKITQMLNQDENEVIINLASNEYFNSIKEKILTAKIIHIVFKENKQNQYKTIGIHAKKARGLMTQYIIKNRLDAPQSLKEFTLAGYQFRGNFSTENQWVFTRG